jgi:hypothetical protein
VAGGVTTQQQPQQGEVPGGEKEIEAGAAFNYTSTGGQQSAVKIVNPTPNPSNPALVAVQKIDPETCQPVGGREFAGNKANLGEPYDKCAPPATPPTPAPPTTPAAPEAPTTPPAPDAPTTQQAAAPGKISQSQVKDLRMAASQLVNPTGTGGTLANFGLSKEEMLAVRQWLNNWADTMGFQLMERLLRLLERDLRQPTFPTPQRPGRMQGEASPESPIPTIQPLDLAPLYDMIGDKKIALQVANHIAQALQAVRVPAKASTWGPLGAEAAAPAKEEAAPGEEVAGEEGEAAEEEEAAPHPWILPLNFLKLNVSALTPLRNKYKSENPEGNFEKDLAEFVNILGSLKQTSEKGAPKLPPGFAPQETLKEIGTSGGVVYDLVKKMIPDNEENARVVTRLLNQAITQKNSATSRIWKAIPKIDDPSLGLLWGGALKKGKKVATPGSGAEGASPRGSDRAAATSQKAAKLYADKYPASLVAKEREAAKGEEEEPEAEAKEEVEGESWESNDGRRGYPMGRLGDPNKIELDTLPKLVPKFKEWVESKNLEDLKNHAEVDDWLTVLLFRILPDGIDEHSPEYADLMRSDPRLAYSEMDEIRRVRKNKLGQEDYRARNPDEKPTPSTSRRPPPGRLGSKEGRGGNPEELELEEKQQLQEQMHRWQQLAGIIKG